MKILMMASSSGFLSYHITRLSINLQKIGHQVIVLSGSKEQVNGLSMELVNSGIEHLISEHIDKKRVRDIYESKKDIRRILEKENIDIIHAHGVTHSLGAYLACKSLHFGNRPSIVTHIHSIPGEGFIGYSKWVLMTTLLNKSSNIILPVSKNTREKLVRHGLNPKKTITVHNAIDLEEFDAASRMTTMDFVRKKKNNKPIVVCVANLVPMKGQEYYLKAAAEVLRSCCATFYVIGSGPQRKYLEKISKGFGIEKKVVYTGRISWPGLYWVLSNMADVCVSASCKELFPFYILECMAAGKPIVATNVGGISEAVVNGVNGYLIPPKDPISMAKAILWLINDSDMANQMGLKGRSLIEQMFSMDVAISKLNTIYEIAKGKYQQKELATRFQSGKFHS